MKIITEGDPRLRKISTTVKYIKNPRYKPFIKDLIRMMYEDDGIGIAAPQVGLNERIIIINTKDGPVPMINPEILKFSWRKEFGEEGCLSVPFKYGSVKRSKSIKAVYQNRDGVVIKIDAKGLLARVIQHEVDHLNGILFIDIAKNIKEKKA
ncbi:peptide deformylase [Patescibacteria group bacterium]|nr:peptide deformylase [Patescibacteria group bacterium]MBU1890733.1 peptide deformylase [Patescibacteria group bacterium]